MRDGEAHDPLGNAAAEEALLGALLTRNSVLDSCPKMTGADFYDPLFGAIFDYIAKGVSEGRRITPITMRREWSTHAGLEEAGGVEALAGIAEATVAVDTADDYARTILDLSHRRKARQAMLDALPKLQSADSLAEVLAEVDGVFLSLEATGDAAGVSFKQVVLDRVEQINAAIVEGVDLEGISTGIPSVDEILGGLRAEELIVLAGRPAMGKSMAACVTAVRTAEAGVGVMIASLEMSPPQWVDRAISMAIVPRGLRVPYERFRRPTDMTEGDFRLIAEAAHQIAPSPIWFASGAARSVPMIAMEARRAQRRFEQDGAELGLIIIDYLGLMETPGRNLAVELGAITGALKSLAKRLSIPILVLCQLSRQVEGRADKRPMLSDLRDSGAIEQDADAVIFAYREHYYIQASEPKVGTPEHAEWEARCQETRNQIELIVAKQRVGRTGTARAACELENNWIR